MGKFLSRRNMVERDFYAVAAFFNGVHGFSVCCMRKIQELVANLHYTVYLDITAGVIFSKCEVNGEIAFFE